MQCDIRAVFCFCGFLMRRERIAAMSKCGGSSPFDFAQDQYDGVKQTTTKAKAKTKQIPTG
jgi:hypothetical protein